MVETKKPSQLYSIILAAVDSLCDSSFDERNEIYDHARATIMKFLGSKYNYDDITKIHIAEEVERIIARVESEHLLRRPSLIQPSHPKSFPNNMMLNGTTVPDGGLEIIPSNLNHDRTTLLVKNIGAGGSVSIVKILIQLALLPTMAHLLGPKEFGVYALAVPVVSFLAVIADGGVGLTLARDKTNASDMWSTAFWMLIASGILLTVFVVFCGYFISLISSEPQLNTVMLILAMSFPFLSVTVLPVARLTRSGNLVTCAMADFVSTVAGAVCAVGLGVMGFGAKSLAFQYLTCYVIRAIILNFYAFERPAAVFRPSTLLSHMSSGGILVGGRIADLACRSCESLLFGNAFGAAALGAYNFANQVPRFLFESFSNPTWAALYAQSLSERHERLLEIYYKVCRLMAFVTFPTAAILAAAGPEILAQALGPKWEEAGVFLQILAPGYALSTTAAMGTALLLATNANVTFFLTTLTLGLGRVSAVAAGYYLSASTSVWLVALSNVIYAVLVCGSVAKTTNARLMSLFKETAGSFLAAAVSGCVCWGVLELMGSGLVVLFEAIVAGAICYIVVSFIIQSKSLSGEFMFLKSVAARAINLNRA